MGRGFGEGMAMRSGASAATLPEFPRWKPSGIPAAAVLWNRGALVSSDLPPWGNLGGSRPLPAMSLWPYPHLEVFKDLGASLSILGEMESPPHPYGGSSAAVLKKHSTMGPMKSGLSSCSEVRGKKE